MHTRIDRRVETVPAEDGGTQPVLRWLILALAALVSVAASMGLAAQWRAVLEPCSVPECHPPQLTAEALGNLPMLGLTVETWASLTLVPTALATAGALTLTILVAWRGVVPASIVIPFVLLLVAVGQSHTFTPWEWAEGLFRAITPLSFFLLLGLFPDARFRPRWTIAPVVLAGSWIVVSLLPPIDRAVSANEQPWSALYGFVFAIAVLGIVAGYVVRYRLGSPAERRALLLLGAVMLPFAVGGGAFSIYQGAESASTGIGTVIGSTMASASALLVLLVYVVIAITAIRDGAYGVRVVLNRVLLGAIGLGIVFAVYAVVTALGSFALGGWMPQAVASAAAALTLLAVFHPTVRGIDRLVYGDADDPDRLAVRLAAALAAAQDSRSVLPDLLELLAERLRLPWVALDAPGNPDPVSLGGAAIALDPGAPGGAVLTVGLRPGQRRLHSRDRAAIQAAAPTLLSGLATVRLTDELQASRRRVVAAAEAERRALRRELHDDLGPTLAAARHRIAAARPRRAGTDTRSGARRQRPWAERDRHRRLRPAAGSAGGRLLPDRRRSSREHRPTRRRDSCNSQHRCDRR
ncbi:MAG: hypothetical protein ACK5LO_14475 [Leucobacter sp.]